MEPNKIIATRHDLKSIELFMGYVDGYLSENITWNDLMPFVEKIEEFRLIYPEQCDKVCNCKIVIMKDRLYELILEFINWYHPAQPNLTTKP